VIFLDIETNLAHDTIWLVVTKKDDEVKAWRDRTGLQQYLDEHQVVAHNGIEFDFDVLAKVWKVHVPEHMQVDTLVMSRLYNPELAPPEEDPKQESTACVAGAFALATTRETSTLLRQAGLRRWKTIAFRMCCCWRSSINT
jgi:hypothetical protein